MSDEPELTEDMRLAMEIMGSPERFVRMLNALSQAEAFLAGHGWCHFGVVMRKGPCEVVLTLEGAIQAGAMSSDAEMPPEIHALAAIGRRPDA